MDAVLHVVFHVLHAGFLGAAHDDAQAVLERRAQFAEHAHQVKAEHGGVLVVVCAAADEEIAHTGRAVGRIDPLLALGHHVDVGDDAQSVTFVAIDGAAAVALVVLGFKAHLAGVIEGEIEHLAALGAKGRARRGEVGAADRADAGERLQIGDHLLGVGVDPGAGGLTERTYIHGKPP